MQTVPGLPRLPEPASHHQRNKLCLLPNPDSRSLGRASLCNVQEDEALRRAFAHSEGECTGNQPKNRTRRISGSREAQPSDRCSSQLDVVKTMAITSPQGVCYPDYRHTSNPTNLTLRTDMDGDDSFPMCSMTLVLTRTSGDVVPSRSHGSTAHPGWCSRVKLTPACGLAGRTWRAQKRPSICLSHCLNNILFVIQFPIDNQGQSEDFYRAQSDILEMTRAQWRRPAIK